MPALNLSAINRFSHKSFQTMRVLFIGTSPFAVPSLQRLSESPEHKVLAVVTQPDDVKGLVPVAFVVPRAGHADSKELQAALSQAIVDAVE